MIPKKVKIKNIIKYHYNILLYKIYVFRYDIFSLFVISIVVLYFMLPILRSGQIVFSDIAFGFTSKRYIEEIFGIWNERYSTSTLLNAPRLIIILPLYLISKFFDYNAEIFLKMFLYLLIYLSAFSMYLFSKRLVSVSFSKDFDFFKTFALITGSVFMD